MFTAQSGFAFTAQLDLASSVQAGVRGDPLVRSPRCWGRGKCERGPIEWGSSPGDRKVKESRSRQRLANPRSQTPCMRLAWEVAGREAENPDRMHARLRGVFGNLSRLVHHDRLGCPPLPEVFCLQKPMPVPGRVLCRLIPSGPNLRPCKRMSF